MKKFVDPNVFVGLPSPIQKKIKQQLKEEQKTSQKTNLKKCN